MAPKKKSAVEPETLPEIEEPEGLQPTVEVTPPDSGEGSGAREADRLSTVEQQLAQVQAGLAKLLASQLGKSVELPTDDTSHRRTGQALARSTGPPSDGGGSSDDDEDNGGRGQQGDLPLLDIHAYRAAIKPGFEEFPPDNEEFQQAQLFPIDKELTYQRIAAKYTNARADPLLEYETLYCYGLYQSVASAALAESVGELYESRAVSGEVLEKLCATVGLIRAVDEGLRDRLAFIRYKFDPKSDPLYRDIALDKLFTPSLAHHGSDRLSAGHRDYTRMRNKATVQQLAKCAASLRTGRKPGARQDEDGGRGQRKGKSADKDNAADKDKAGKARG